MAKESKCMTWLLCQQKLKMGPFADKIIPEADFFINGKLSYFNCSHYLKKNHKNLHLLPFEKVGHYSVGLLMSLRVYVFVCEFRVCLCVRVYVRVLCVW